MLGDDGDEKHNDNIHQSTIFKSTHFHDRVGELGKSAASPKLEFCTERLGAACCTVVHPSNRRRSKIVIVHNNLSVKIKDK